MERESLSPWILSRGGALSIRQIKQVVFELRNGGLCLLPSDTGYTLAAFPFSKVGMERLEKVLPEKKLSPISLSFSSLRLVEQFVRLTAKDYRIIEEYMPGPVTLVCKMSNALPPQSQRALSQVLHTHGTIGVRIPDSSVERQISEELARPITTCAVRDAAGEIVQKFEEARDIVLKRIEALREEGGIPLIAIRANFVVKYHEHSTVVSVQFTKGQGPYTVFIYREGEVSPKKLESSVRHMSFWELEDFT